MTSDRAAASGSSRSGADVTVVMPAFNRSQTIARALTSVARQTVRPREVIVVDDASTDDTVAIAGELGATVLTTAVNAGSGPARNRGIEAASTAWVAFLDSDDEWHPEHLATLLPHTDGHVLVASSGVTDTGRPIGNPTSHLLRLTPRIVLESSEIVLTSASMASRDALIAAGLFRPLRRAQDLDMWVRLLGQGPGVGLPGQTATYHEHDAQASADHDLMFACFVDIVEHSKSQLWFRPGIDVDRAYARIHWDEMRQSHSRADHRTALAEARWLARRPHVWPPLVRMLRLRRARRRLVDRTSGRG